MDKEKDIYDISINYNKHNQIMNYNEDMNRK